VTPANRMDVTIR